MEDKERPVHPNYVRLNELLQELKQVINAETADVEVEPGAEPLHMYLGFCELHVDDRTFYLHRLITAPSLEVAHNSLSLWTASKGTRGDNYHLQAKGILGKATPERLEKYMLVSPLGKNSRLSTHGI